MRRSAASSATTPRAFVCRSSSTRQRTASSRRSRSRRPMHARQRDGDARRHAPRARPRPLAARIPRVGRGHGHHTARDERGVRDGRQRGGLVRAGRSARRRTSSSHARSSDVAASSSTCRATSWTRAGMAERRAAARPGVPRLRGATRGGQAKLEHLAPSSSSRTSSSIPTPTAWCCRSCRARSPASR